jgi:hypothetical protein
VKSFSSAPRASLRAPAAWPLRILRPVVITRDSRLSNQSTCYEAYYSGHAPLAIFIKSHRIWPGQGLGGPLPVELSSPTPARWPTGFLPWQSPPSHAAGEGAGEEGGRKGASSAAALIGSRPLDVLIALARGVARGRLQLHWLLVVVVALVATSFFLLGKGGRGDHTLVPAAPCTDSTGVPLR